MEAIKALSSSSISGLNIFNLSRNRGPADVEVRSFAPSDGVDEDPVCGSGNGCVAAVIQRHNLLDGKSYVASQGRCRQRDGRVEVRFDGDGAIWLGGKAITCVEGVLKQY
jgi:PhzF family phenazine biosynthesis protein